MPITQNPTRSTCKISVREKHSNSNEGERVWERGRLITCAYVNNPTLTAMNRNCYRTPCGVVATRVNCRCERRLAGDCQRHKDRSGLIKHMPAPRGVPPWASVCVPLETTTTLTQRGFTIVLARLLFLDILGDISSSLKTSSSCLLVIPNLRAF
jgi:hypothetical protein